MKAKAKSTRSDSFGSANLALSETAPAAPKPGALLIAETKTLIVSASKDGKLRIACNSFTEPVVIKFALMPALIHHRGL